jgi:hypothetical protein
MCQLEYVYKTSIDRVGFEHRFWDPGAPEDSQFIGFADFNPTHYPELSIDEFQQKFWDPRSSEELMSMQFMRRSADFIPAHYHELHIAWPCFIVLTQQKGSGTSKLALEIMWVVYVVSTSCINSEDLANAWDIVLLQFSVVLFSEFSVACLVFSGSVLKLSKCHGILYI